MVGGNKRDTLLKTNYLSRGEIDQATTKEVKREWDFKKFDSGFLKGLPRVDPKGGGR